MSARQKPRTDQDQSNQPTETTKAEHKEHENRPDAAPGRSGADLLRENRDQIQGIRNSLCRMHWHVRRGSFDEEDSTHDAFVRFLRVNPKMRDDANIEDVHRWLVSTSWYVRGTACRNAIKENNVGDIDEDLQISDEGRCADPEHEARCRDRAEKLIRRWLDEVGAPLLGPWLFDGAKPISEAERAMRYRQLRAACDAMKHVFCCKLDPERCSVCSGWKLTADEVLFLRERFADYAEPYLRLWNSKA